MVPNYPAMILAGFESGELSISDVVRDVGAIVRKCAKTHRDAGNDRNAATLAGFADRLFALSQDIRTEGW